MNRFALSRTQRVASLLFTFHFSFLIFNHASAQSLPQGIQDGAISLDSCINMALRANRQMEKAQLQTRQREYAMKAVKANFFPNFKAAVRDIYSNAKGSFSIEGGYLPTFTPGADGTMQPNVMMNPATGLPVMGPDGVTPVFQQYAYFPTQELKYKINNIIQAGITLEQPIYMGGKIRAGYAMSQLARDMAQENERLTEAQVIVKAEEAYALLVRATEMHGVALVYDSLLQRLHHDVSAAKSHGMASHNDVLKVGVKRDEALLKVRQAENGLRLARMNLCQIVGLPLLTQLTPNRPSPSPSLKERGADAADSQGNLLTTPLPLREEPGVGSLSQRPEAQLLDMKSKLAEEKVRLERSEFLPQIGLMAGYNYLYGLKVNDHRLLDGGNFGALLNVSIPLYHFGEGRNKVRAARMEAEQARVEQRDLMEQMQLEATREGNNLDEALLELDITTHSLAQSAENLRAAQKSYDAGMESLSDLLEAQTLYQQALARQVEARCQVSLSAARYRKAIGQNLR